MLRRMPIVAITLRSLVDRRRFWLMVLLAAAPVLLALVSRAFGGERLLREDVFEQLIVRTVLPLIALVFGTAALGADLDDGNIVYLISKPIRRSRVVLAKGVVAVALTVVLVVPATLLTGLLIATADDATLESTLAWAFAVGLGGTAYALGFLALSSFTSRALAIGLAYVLLWEGVLAGLFEGAGTFSVRKASLELAEALQGPTLQLAGRDAVPPDATSALVILGAVILGGLALATWRLSRYQLRGGD